MTAKIKSIHILSGKIIVKSGLHIGAGNDVIEIGGLDNPVLKDREGMPYIPGSSIKGKLRSLMEWKHGRVPDGNGMPCSCSECIVCRIFGPHKAKEMKDGPPRLIVRDAHLSKEFEKEISLTEAKYENTINRITGTADHPRQLERVHAGTVFNFEIIYRNFMYDEASAENDRKALKEVIDLMKYDYLGGSGSRGSGHVEFKAEPDQWRSEFQQI